MASNLIKNLEDQVTCAICQEHFRDPRLLPCLHTYCKQCLTDLVRASTMKGQVTCPECREPVQMNPGGIEKLKVNFQMNNLISLLAISSLEQDTKKSELMCENCNSNDIAKGRCVVCSNFLCDFCIKAHKRFLETQDHRVMTLDEVKKHGTPAMSQQPKCGKHKGEIQKLYCETCQQLICRDCTIIDHRDHCYQFIDDVAGQHKKSLKAVLDVAIEAKCEVEKTRGLVQEMKLKIKIKCDNVQREIANAVNEQIAVLKQKERNLIAEAKKHAEERTKSLDKQEQVLATKLENLTSSVQFTQDILQDGDSVTILSISTEANSRLATLVDEMRLLETKPRQVDNFSFEVNRETLQQSVDNEMFIVQQESINLRQQMKKKPHKRKQGKKKGLRFSELKSELSESKVIADEFQDNQCFPEEDWGGKVTEDQFQDNQYFPGGDWVGNVTKDQFQNNQYFSQEDWAWSGKVTEDQFQDNHFFPARDW